MKLKVFFAFITISVIVKIVKGVWWALALNPVILSLGAILTAIDQDVLNIQPIELRSWFSTFKNQEEKVQKEEKIEQDELTDAELGIEPLTDAELGIEPQMDWDKEQDCDTND